MKKPIFVFCTFLSSIFFFNAQITNTFPDSGNVGIGTTTPSDKLEIDGNIRIKDNKSILFGNSGTASASIKFGSDDVLRFYNSDSEEKINFPVGGGDSRIVLQPNGGFVGIYNSNPSYTLDVTGTGRFTSNLLIGDPNGARTEINTSTNHKIFAPTNKKTIDLDGNYHGGGFVGVYRADNGIHGVIMESQPSLGHNGLFLREMRNNNQNINGIILYSTVFSGDTAPTNYISLPGQKSLLVIGENGEYKMGQNFGLINKLKTSFENDVYVEAGNVGIGTTDTKGFKLGVQGKIAAEEVKVAMYNNWADFVFESNYNLPTLQEVEQHIKEKGHLKDIPSAKEVEENGILLGNMNAKLLQKIEELTLYTIQQQKLIEEQAKVINEIQQKLKD